MGIGVSNWQLARDVSILGELGVVSGTGLNSVLLRRLQDGDRDGKMRHALAHFPDQAITQRLLSDYFIADGKRNGVPYKRSPMYALQPSLPLLQLTVAASFVEVFLAKEGHRGMVGINFLEKIQLATLPGLYGAMLAGVDYVLMGAGIPREIPGVLDRFALHQEASLAIHVEDAGPTDEYRLTLNPQDVVSLSNHEPLRRPYFLAIVASAVLANSLAKKSTGRVDGFVVENATAGGHNAPPRGPLRLSDDGQPVYGEKDIVDMEKMRALQLPFWLAGSYATPEKLREALQLGANGIQVGTAFAFAAESGIDAKLKDAVLAQAAAGIKPNVFTDPSASPTGFPFKAVDCAGTIANEAVYAARPRKCDLGYLRVPAKLADGRIAYRCPAEPPDIYEKKGGKRDDTINRKCLCNSLLATVGMPQNQEDGYVERPLLTAGDDLANLARYLLNPDAATFADEPPANAKRAYSAKDVIHYLRSML